VVVHAPYERDRLQVFFRLQPDFLIAHGGQNHPFAGVPFRIVQRFHGEVQENFSTGLVDLSCRRDGMTAKRENRKSDRCVEPQEFIERFQILADVIDEDRDLQVPGNSRFRGPGPSSGTGPGVVRHDLCFRKIAFRRLKHHPEDEDRQADEKQADPQPGAMILFGLFDLSRRP